MGLLYVGESSKAFVSIFVLSMMMMTTTFFGKIKVIIFLQAWLGKSCFVVILLKFLCWRHWFNSWLFWCYEINNCEKIYVIYVSFHVMLFKKVKSYMLQFLGLFLAWVQHKWNSLTIVINKSKHVRWWSLNDSSSKTFTYNDNLAKSSIYNNVMWQNIKIVKKLNNQLTQLFFFTL